MQNFSRKKDLKVTILAASGEYKIQVNTEKWEKQKKKNI
jgi:hypothetical protein